MKTIADVRHDNLLTLISEFGTIAKLAFKIEKSPTQISQLKNRAVNTKGRGKPRAIGDDLAREIEQKLGKPLGWMDTNHKTLESNANILGTFEEWDDNTPLHEDDVEIPFFKDVELAAGISRTNVEDYNGFKLRFAKSALKKSGVTISNAVCVTVSGNSMEPALREGSTVGIDMGNTAVKDGTVYAIDHDGDLRIKQLYKLPGGGLRLRSFNREEWDDEDLSPEYAKNVRIIGKVFWSSTFW